MKRQLLFTILAIAFVAILHVSRPPIASADWSVSTSGVTAEFREETKEWRIKTQKFFEKVNNALEDIRDFPTNPQKMAMPAAPREVVADITNPNGRVCYYSFDGKNYILHAPGKKPDKARQQRLIAACQTDLYGKSRGR